MLAGKTKQNKNKKKKKKYREGRVTKKLDTRLVFSG